MIYIYISNMLICIFNRSKLCMLMFIYVGDEHVYRYGYIYIYLIGLWTTSEQDNVTQIGMQMNAKFNPKHQTSNPCNPNRNADECRIQSQTPNFESSCRMTLIGNPHRLSWHMGPQQGGTDDLPQTQRSSRHAQRWRGAMPSAFFWPETVGGRCS